MPSSKSKSKRGGTSRRTKPRTPRSRTSRRDAGWLRLLLRRTTIAAVLIGVVLPIVAIVPLAWINPPTTAFMLARAVSDPPCDAIRYEWVDALRLPRHVSWAAIAAEDQKFHGHFGFDLGAIRAAVSERETLGRVRGASTITQQLAKNLFLWSGRSWVRKGIEAYLTLWIELLLPKGRILELYVNVAQLTPCSFGVGAASQEVYGKGAAELSPREAARLAAVLPSPETLRAEPATPYIRRRGEQILRQMENLFGALPDHSPPVVR